MLNAIEIETFVARFLSSNSRKGALLVSGEWGSGKTHLALTRLQPLAEKAGLKTIYLTVSDIDSQEAFDRKLFLASYQLLEAKILKRATQVGFDYLSSFLSNKGVQLKDIVSIDRAIDERTLLIIDDLERAEATLRKRVLYKVANLIEAKGAKVLLLADESRIAGDVEYPVIKEKAVSRTVLFQPTYEDIAKTATQVVYDAPPGATDNSNHWNIEKYLTQSEFQEVLTTILSRGSCRNLRTAISAAVDACELSEQINWGATRNLKTLVKAATYSTLAIALELKNDRNNLTALRKYANSSTEIPWIHFMPNGDPLKDYLTVFESKYVDSAGFLFLRSENLINYLEHGGCNFESLTADIAGISPEEPETPAYKRMGRYQSIQRDDFEQLEQRALTELRELQIRSFHSLGTSAQTLFFLASRRLLNVQPVDLRILYVDTIDQLSREYLNNANDISIEFDNGLVWHQPQGELKLVLEHIQRKANELDQARFTREKRAAIEKLRTDANSFTSCLVSVDSPIATQACLKPEDAVQIAEILQWIALNNPIPHQSFYKVERGIAHRYGNRTLGISLDLEADFLSQLHSGITEIRILDEDKLLQDAKDTLIETISNAINTVLKPK